MNALKSLKTAIETRKSIKFTYDKPDKVKGERIGNPHAIFIFTKKSGEQGTKVHIVQTEGVSDSRSEVEFPDFGTFDIEWINNVEILNDRGRFTVDERYNPEWEHYDHPIVKI